MQSGQECIVVWFFDDFELNVEKSELRRQGRLIPLQEKPFQLLALLVERAGQQVTRDTIRQRLWGTGTFVEFDDSLNHAVRKVRDALGDSAEIPRFIKTIPRRGYEFIAPVRAGSSGSAKPPAVPAAPAQPAAPRRTVIAAAVIAVTIAAAAAWLLLAGATSAHVTSLVVLPFENLGSDKADEYFGDGLTEELINRLSSVKGLRVLARTTTFHFKGRADDVREIARKLNVEAILSGSVRRQGDSLRITAHLSRGSDGVQMWSQAFDRRSIDVFAVQEEIAEALASRLGSGGGPNPPQRTANQQAHRLLLLGNFHRAKFDEADLEKAIEYYRQAAAKDPNYARPYAEMAYAYAALGNALLKPPAEVYPAALAAASKAVAMDESIPAAHTGLGIYHLAYAWDWAAADRELRRAIELNPCEAQAHHWRSHYFQAMGRFSESLEASLRAVECDPLALDLNHHLGEHYCAVRDFGRCIAAEQKTLELDSRYGLALWKLRTAYQAQGRFADANQLLRAAGQMEMAQRLDRALSRGGKTGYWRENARMMMEGHADMAAPFIAFALAQAGEKQEALDWLERSYAARSFFLINIRSHWELDPLRSEPGFRKLVEQMRFP